MEALYFGNNKGWGWGSGPWVMADLENGLFSGVNRGFNAGDPTVDHRFLTAMLKGGPNQWALRGGNAQSGGLSTFYNGVRPTVSGYNPMHKEGAIILGIGGDNSKWAQGTFYEGVMTQGYPSDGTEDAVQANITAVGYDSGSTSTGSLTPGSRISLKATTSPCCTSHYLRHNDADTKVVISSINSASSATDKSDATWIVRAGLANTSCLSFESANKPGQFLRHFNYQLNLNFDDGGSAFAKDATFCPTTGNRRRRQLLPVRQLPDEVHPPLQLHGLHRRQWRHQRLGLRDVVGPGHQLAHRISLELTRDRTRDRIQPMPLIKRGCRRPPTEASGPV